jgi:GT2 family glycosyltransferase
MNNFSVIIPTIWKGPWIYDLLERFCNNEYVDDIILINNNKSDSKEIPTSPKINIVTPEENLFVNPSWNLGVSLAKNKNIIISNDDILFNVDKYIEHLQSLYNLKEYGIIGVNSDNYTLEEDTAISLNHYGEFNNTGGWACLLAFHAETWAPIPERIKIYYGDNFIQMVCKPILELRGIQIKTVMSSSANTSVDWVKNITDNDLVEWFNILGGR